MDLTIIICIAMGLALNLYAALVCKGAVLARIDGKKLGVGTLIFCGWQLGMLIVGNGLCRCVGDLYQTERMKAFTEAGSIVLLVLFVLHMLYRAWKNEPVEERRQEVLQKRDVLRFAMRMGVPTAVAGLVFGFADSSLRQQIVVVAVTVLLVFICGIYSGYRFGYIQKRGAYLAGAAFHIAAEVYLVAQYFHMA